MYKINKNRNNILRYVLLHMILFFYSILGVVAKLSSKNPIQSYNFITLYCLMLCMLCIYAIFWQKLLKYMSLTVAFSNKSVVLIWGMIWGKIFFDEIITWNMILGAMVICFGIWMVVFTDD